MGVGPTLTLLDPSGKLGLVNDEWGMEGQHLSHRNYPRLNLVI